MRQQASLSPLPVILLVLAFIFNQSEAYGMRSAETTHQHGDVSITARTEGDVKYVSGTIVVPAPVDKVWPVVVNPFEYPGKIFPRMSKVEVLSDEPSRSLLRETVNVPIFSPLTYDVISEYDLKRSRIEFHRVAGAFKDFRGFWSLEPVDGGAHTQATYGLYIETGMPVPQWLVNAAVKLELPKTLRNVKRRAVAVAQSQEPPERRTIMAADPAGAVTQ